MNKHAPIHAPVLDHDAMMFKRFGTKVSVQGKLERRIVANLIAHLQANNFRVCSVYDGEEIEKISPNGVEGMRAAMEIIFNLDEAAIQFIHNDAARITDWHDVSLVLGNGIDIISDWNFFNDDRDGFEAVMDAFDAEEYA